MTNTSNKKEELKLEIAETIGELNGVQKMIVSGKEVSIVEKESLIDLLNRIQKVL